MPGKRPANASLRALLAEAEWTEEQLARKVNEIAVENGEQARYDRSSVSRWLSGTVPHSRRRQFVIEALSRRLRRSLGPADVGWPPEPEQEAVPSDPLARLEPLLESRSLLTGEFTYRVFPPPVAPVLGDAADAPSRLAPEDSISRTLNDAVSFFAQAADVGGWRARTALAAYVRHEAIPSIRVSGPTAGPRLADTARLVHLLARIAQDDDASGLAQRYYHAAADLAVAAGDSVTYATVLRAISAQASLLGHRRHALRVAERAREAMDASAPAGVRAYVLTQLAVSQALLGEARRAYDNLGLAERAYGEGHASEHEHIPPAFSTYTEASFRYQKAQVLVADGRRSLAVTELLHCLRQRPLGSGQAAAQTQLLLTRLLLREKRIDEACGSCRQLLELPHLMRSRRQRRGLAELRREFRSFAALPSVRDLLSTAELGHAPPAPLHRSRT
ncbi:hypothetical protein ABZ397_15610 [Streptomyces sp. NPDC005876]|uniref:hypothetical protein n=1 Tax=Streptomyces sp. NPDC005876 TaxID=3157076 RepID=UPI003407A7A3